MCHRLGDEDAECLEDDGAAESIEQLPDEQRYAPPLTHDQQPADEQRHSRCHQHATPTKPVGVPTTDEAADHQANIDGGGKEVDSGGGWQETIGNELIDHGRHVPGDVNMNI